jgi:hypothetical protein
MRVVDNLIAIRILWLLVTPFEKTKAFQLGLIDGDGNRIKKATTTEESNATSMLHRLVWRIKKFINLVPGGSTKIGSIVAAYALVRENLEKNNYLPDSISLTESYENPGPYYDNSQEFALIIEELREDAPANATGAAVSTNEPAIKKVKKFKGVSQKAMDSFKNGKSASRRITPFLNLEDSQVDWDLFEYVTESKDVTLILNDSKVVRIYKETLGTDARAVVESVFKEWQIEVVDFD